jgi:hypothetical protein
MREGERIEMEKERGRINEVYKRNMLDKVNARVNFLFSISQSSFHPVIFQQ